MKHLLFLLFLALAHAAQAQSLYPELPYNTWDMAISRKFTKHAKLIDALSNQYLGFSDRKGNICGFGYYLDKRGNQRIGIFNEGEFIYGITLMGEKAVIGTERNFACYSITDQTLLFVMNNKVREQKETATRFVTIDYDNGDRYLGESRDGKADGLGIYYYANGDFWFGQFSNGQRNGFGCLFANDYTLTAGQWSDGQPIRISAAKAK